MWTMTCHKAIPMMMLRSRLLPTTTSAGTRMAIVRTSSSTSRVLDHNDERSSSSMNHHRSMHSTAKASQADIAEAVIPSSTTITKTTTNPLLDRFVVTGEVIVSKIFPAGFGWQMSSIVAGGYYGMASDSLSFALSTGMGDALGVLLGHSAYYGIKSMLVDKSIDMKQEVQTGILLSSAAFCSGSLWQPLVNTLQGAELGFSSVLAGTWMGCGLAFYYGLRIARTLLHQQLPAIAAPSFENSQTDVALSVSIGGATGFFVGTDVAYLPDQNFLKEIVGITEGTPDLMGCAIAGTSTSLGFASSQTFLNVAYPRGKCWND